MSSSSSILSTSDENKSDSDTDNAEFSTGITDSQTSEMEMIEFDTSESKLSSPSSTDDGTLNGCSLFVYNL